MAMVINMTGDEEDDEDLAKAIAASLAGALLPSRFVPTEPAARASSNAHV
jgi:hypothetical protein